MARVALFGTMLTNWREGVASHLRANGHVPVDNTDPRWPDAATAEEILPLLRQDHEFMRTADIVLWHHDAGTPGDTARFELGIPALFGRWTVVHVDPGTPSREYMRALCLLYPSRLHWADSMEDALTFIQRLAEALSSRE